MWMQNNLKKKHFNIQMLIRYSNYYFAREDVQPILNFNQIWFIFQVPSLRQMLEIGDYVINLQIKLG